MLCIMPYEPKTAKEHFAFQRMKNAAELVDAVDDARRSNEVTTRNANNRFYNNLALFSGGTIALSVTYLGYLKTLSRPIQHMHWLMGSWIALIVCALPVRLFGRSSTDTTPITFWRSSTRKP
jgi:hypothetical protein